MKPLAEAIKSRFPDAAANASFIPPHDTLSITVERTDFDEAGRVMKLAKARLAGLWGNDETGFGGGFTVNACYAKDGEYVIVVSELPAEDPSFPSLTIRHISAFRFERQIESLYGFIPTGHAHSDHRPWIRFEDWEKGFYPLRKSSELNHKIKREEGSYEWAKASGEGVYEIPVGPVHAGIIEPGHFRFQALGEDIINLEQRLGYTHKGIEKLFESMTLQQGYRLAGRVSGDSTAAHTLAYCRAVEAVTETQITHRAEWIRAVFLELERIANHLGDIGAIANDAAFAFFLYQFSRLKEMILRLSRLCFGHRYLMDRIVPGGVAADISADSASEIRKTLEAVSSEFEKLLKIYDLSPSLEDRLRTTGILKPETASQSGAVGFVARGSGQNLDCRKDTPFPPYNTIIPQSVVLNSSDVHARAWVRVEEIRVSVRLITELLDSLPEGEVIVPLKPVSRNSAFTVVEGWRGEILYWLQCDNSGRIIRCMVRDPSSVNWLGLEQAVLGNIVPDFPLCNKSFNQSYSGNDL